MAFGLMSNTRAVSLALKVSFQDPELLIDPARDVGIDRCTAGVFHICSLSDAASHNRGVVCEALHQRYHMVVPLHERTWILRQLR